MTPVSSVLLRWVLGLVWFFCILWPMMGIKPEGLEFLPALRVFGVVAVGTGLIVAAWLLRTRGKLDFLDGPASGLAAVAQAPFRVLPGWLIIAVAAALVMSVPAFANRYVLDVAINVFIYICLGLGLNVVVGLCGLLDLGYIAFYGVGAYTYALLSVAFGVSFWLCLPIAAFFAAIAGCIVGYPTLRMRGDYLAIVTLGFGEILRLILNNWMSLTNGPNGVMGIQPPVVWLPDWAQGLTFEAFALRQLPYLYYVILALTILTVLGVKHLSDSRIGRAWEAIREDETAAELMGVNTFFFKLMAYAMGAMFGGLAGAFFAARMRYVNPASFTFMESAIVLSMVVLGGLASIPGVLVGALLLIVLPEVFREFEAYRMLCFGAAMAVMMVVKPKGIIPAQRFGKRGEED